MRGHDGNRHGMGTSSAPVDGHNARRSSR
jgi:hypothetical protein